MSILFPFHLPLAILCQPSASTMEPHSGYNSGLPLDYDFSKPPNSPARLTKAPDHLEIESPGTHNRILTISGANADSIDSRIVLHRNADQGLPLLIETLARQLLSCALIGTATGSLPWETGFRSHPTPSRTQSPTRSHDESSSSNPKRKRARGLSAGDDSYPDKRFRRLSVCLIQVTDGVRDFVPYDDGSWRDKEDGTPLLVRFDIGDLYKSLVLKVCMDSEFEALVLKWNEKWGGFRGYDAAAGIGFFIRKHVVDQMIWEQNVHLPGLTLADDCL